MNLKCEKIPIFALINKNKYFNTQISHNSRFMLFKHCKSVPVMVGALSMMLLSGCKDDSLDLGNIDKTLKFEVNDLVIPLNLAPVTFGDMVDITSEECIEEINGEYVLVQKGDFNSESIEIASINASATHLNTSEPIEIPALVANIPPIHLSDIKYDFSYNQPGVDKYIDQVISGEVDLTLHFHINVAYKGTQQGVACQYNNIKFNLPAGFYGTANGTPVNKETGHIVAVPNVSNNPGEFLLDFHVTEFDFEAAGAQLENHNFDIQTSLGIADGEIVINDNSGKAALISTGLDIDPLTIETFTGWVSYNIDDLSVENIDLSDIPDVLRDETTDIRVLSPQLYVKLQNPLAEYNVKAQTQLNIQQVRDGQPTVEPNIELERTLVIEDIVGDQSFCIYGGEEAPKTFYDPETYANPAPYKMINMGKVIAGKGIPEGLKVNFVDPKMPSTLVRGFRLGTQLGAINGSYTFYAPLALGAGSTIYYSDRTTGWDLSGSDDNELEIKRLKLTADVFSELPVNVTLKATPLNSEGEAIPEIKVAPVHIRANEQSSIVIEMEGNIIDLDGMDYSVSVDAGQNTSALRPDMQLKLTNLRVLVSGSMIIDANEKDED